MGFLNSKGVAPIIIVVLIALLGLVILVASNTKTSITPTPQPEAGQPLAETPNPTPTPTPKPTFLPTPKSTTAPVVSSPTPKPVVINNSPPGAGYSYQYVNVDGKSFPVAIVAADLNSTRVIVDTASDSDCRNDCPVLSLGDYAARNGAYAGINGSYFCPADYAFCADKKNSFDTLLMNKNKTYFNSDNNVYSTVPAAIFSPGSARFVGQSLEWGRDTSVDAVLANYPLLVAGGNINFTEAPNEPKFGGAAPRTFIAAKGNMVYIGIVYQASMGESAKVLKALGMDGALNLDQGGSTTLWSGGYKAGPGRGIPNAILFVQR